MAAMRIRSLDPNPDQIAKWIRLSAERFTSAAVPAHPSAQLIPAQSHPGFDFKKARQALLRARTKTEIATIKPLRRLRTNQAAVNEGLIDSLSALMAVNKLMASEIAALTGEISDLRGRLASRPAAADGVER